MTNKFLSHTDTDALFAFYTNLSDDVQELFRPFPNITIDVIASHLTETNSGAHISLGLHDGKQIVGHAFVLRTRDRNPIFGIGLDAEYHGQGLGPVLAMEVLAEADQCNATNITLTVLKRNEKAIRMYTRLGFDLRGDHTFKQLNDSYFMIRGVKGADDSSKHADTEQMI